MDGMTPELPKIVCRNCGNTISRADQSPTGWTHIGDWQGKRCPGLLVGASPDVKKFGEAAYRDGRRDVLTKIGADFTRIARSCRESLVSTPPEYANEAATHRGRAIAFERAAEIVSLLAGEIDPS